MIPQLIELAGSPWKTLPPGVHQATLTEAYDCFATNGHRRMLFDGLKCAATALANAGVGNIYLDGSFVTGKPKPGDYDACWDPTGVIPEKLDMVFLDFDNNRANQKVKYLGEFFPFNWNAAGNQPYIDFFQTDRFTGGKKGILVIDLSGESLVPAEEMQL